MWETQFWVGGWKALGDGEFLEPDPDWRTLSKRECGWAIC
jgi:hypothetical protein